MSYTNHCGRFCGTDWRGREYHYHGKRLVRRKGRQRSEHIDRSLGLVYQDHGQVRAAELRENKRALS